MLAVLVLPLFKMEFAKIMRPMPYKYLQSKLITKFIDRHSHGKGLAQFCKIVRRVKCKDDSRNNLSFQRYLGQ